ncbi:MAG: hypothetical protein AAGI38_06920 [Bacteroidota bacterium]
MKPITLLTAGLCMLLCLTSCKKDEDDNPSQNPNEIIDPTDAALLARALEFSNSSRRRGDMPETTGTSTAPDIDNLQFFLRAYNGETIPVEIEFELSSGRVDGYYVTVSGADLYYEVPWAEVASRRGILSIPLNIPSNIGEGEFCLEYAIFDDQNRVSNDLTTCFEILRAESGLLEITMEWFNEDDDLNLHVIEPSGDTLNLRNLTSNSGATFTVGQVINETRRESAYWERGAPDGQYRLLVENLSSFTFPNFFNLLIEGRGVDESFGLTVPEGAFEEIMTFTKSGDNFSF